MPTPDAFNLGTSDPEDYMFVSKKNWARKNK
jgi:hypothetical protein